MFRINDTIEFQNEEYVITDFLGQGGMGHVFLIRNKANNSKLALKSLQYFLPDDNNYRSLFNEWQQAQTINHKNVIRYLGFHDGLSEPTTPYLIMELANDGSLENYLKSLKSLLDEDECLSIFHQIINGMEAVNQVLIHRDIKPANIFINNGDFKIADFGLAKIAQDKTRSKTFKGWGTEPYIAPEAYRAEKNTIQMDMYSIGHVFYQIAALKHAFGNPNDWEQAHLTAVPASLSNINPNISAKVISVINKLISKKPSNRYSSWDEVRQDLVRSTKNTSDNKSAIEKILHSKISRDLEKEKQLSAQQLLEKETQRKSDLLNFQFNDEVISPLRTFVDDFNKINGSTSGMSISQNSGYNSSGYVISFDGKKIKIWFHQINDSDVIESYQNNIWGENVIHKTKPVLNNKPVLAWGGIESNDGRGINIVLVKSDEDEYGDWFILKNKLSGFGRPENRADPFAFSSAELVKEIHTVHALHIYNTQIIKLQSDEIVRFISNLFE